MLLRNGWQAWPECRAGMRPPSHARKRHGGRRPPLPAGEFIYCNLESANRRIQAAMRKAAHFFAKARPAVPGGVDHPRCASNLPPRGHDRTCPAGSLKEAESDMHASLVATSPETRLLDSWQSLLGKVAVHKFGRKAESASCKQAF